MHGSLYCSEFVTCNHKFYNWPSPEGASLSVMWYLLPVSWLGVFSGLIHDLIDHLKQSNFVFLVNICNATTQTIHSRNAQFTNTDRTKTYIDTLHDMKKKCYVLTTTPYGRTEFVHGKKLVHCAKQITVLSKKRFHYIVVFLTFKVYECFCFDLSH